MAGLSMANRRAAPPPRLDLEIVRRQQQQEKQQQQQQGRTDPNTPTGPLTPNRPLIVSELPVVAIPHATTSKPALLTPSSTRPSTPIPTSTRPPPDPATPTLPVPRTTFHTSTRVPSVPSVPSVQPAPSGPNFGGSLSQASLSPTNIVFVTQPPQTVTVTAPAVVPTFSSTSHTSSTIPLPSEAADTTPQPSALPANNGVSFTTGAGVVVIGVLGGIASASLLGMASTILWRKHKRRRREGVTR